MKHTFKRFALFGAALTLLGSQAVFAADQVREKAQDKKHEQSCIKEDAESTAKDTTKEKKAQTETSSEKPAQSDEE